MLNAQTQYSDIIFHRHHVSQSRPHMSVHSRAAQFAPFAALTGFGNVISKTAKYAEEKSRRVIISDVSSEGVDLVDES